MYLCDSICNVLNFLVFDHTSSVKHDVPSYGVDEAYSIDVHEVTASGDLLVLIKDGFSNTWYLNRIHMLNLEPHYFAFYVWYSGSIDILGHPNILLRDWRVMQDVIINCIKDSLYRFISGVL